MSEFYKGWTVPDVIDALMAYDHGATDSGVNDWNMKEVAMPQFMQADIPMPAEVVRLNDIFRKDGFEIYVVGGCIRDFLIAEEEWSRYTPKDVDLATDAHPQEIARMLDGAGVRNFEKGESFGVWVAHMNGQDFELATFRTDGEYKDGRHPERVVWTTSDEDYKRRDLTINALFYRLPITSIGILGVIIDYGDGVGFQDIKDRRIRTVGDPKQRFAEDKLRVLRAVRFHHRLNDESICEKRWSNYKLIDAIRTYHDLRAHGISGPRIMTEFLTCLRQSRSLRHLISDLDWLGLIPQIFPGLKCDVSHHPLKKLDESGLRIDPAIVIAWILRHNDSKEVKTALNRLNYPSEVYDDVAFLIETKDLFNEARAEDNRCEKLMLQALNMTRNPHRRTQLGQIIPLLFDYIDFDPHVMFHLVSHEVKHYDGVEVMKKWSIPQGPALGKFIRQLQTHDYNESLMGFDSSHISRDNDAISKHSRSSS